MHLILLFGCYGHRVHKYAITQIRLPGKKKNPQPRPDSLIQKKIFSTLGTLLDKVLNCTYSIAVIKLWRIQVADFQAEISFTQPYWVSAGAYILQFTAPFHLSEASKFPVQLTPASFNYDVSPTKDNSQSLPSQHDIQLYFCQTGEVLVFILHIKLVLSGCGGNTEWLTSKQNSWRFFSRYLPLHSTASLALYLPLIPCSSLSTPFLFTSHQTPSFLPLSWPAYGPTPAVPGKSWLWYPRKTSQRERSIEWWGGGQHLAQHIISTVDSFSNIEENNACVTLYFSYCQQN